MTRGPGFLRETGDEAFRAGLRDWLAAALPVAAGDRLGTADLHGLAFRREWEDHLCRSGLSGLGWPEALGGHALSLTRQAIFHEECARAGTPLPVNMIGHGIVAPTLIDYGSADQKQRYLPRILSNSEIWCQGYSEPGAGSDLAALATRAERRDDVYVLNGQKIWTSFADIADRCLLLARTGGGESPRAGISVLLVDMRLPGITVRPIRQITGEADYNEVFFDDVEVPADCLLGEENGGWRIAMAAANYERSTYFVPRIVRMQAELDALVLLAAGTFRHGQRLIDDPAVRSTVTDLSLNVQALRLYADRILEMAEQGVPPGVDGSSVKLLWSENHQRLLDLAMDILGPDVVLGPQERSAPAEGRWNRDYLWTRAETILAGTSEIHRNIIAERGLGLPR
ncbi:acyl-CoA dehydrogenase family protein [Microbaculum marinisediminis]|uniref:Acyl-CoA dehydrogenase family protein n=1 Tax=Microbaculum marinisediminis TaxID=2931392 RepID=A0AAW5R572_9HYPH|nr:acyl-CoA dehydrogenase family protein [Microbaculum sp. A6E488]MCT8973774.1 acyl-CoA dehydrogenase family protein [Microbaculum sp. A6E488]